jgi:IS1 family transposase
LSWWQTSLYPSPGIPTYLTLVEVVKQYEQVAKLSTYGLASEAIAEVFNREPRTIDNWLSAIGRKNEQFQLFICLTSKLKLMFLPLDELWSYCRAKYHKLWVFIGLEAATKFWINFELGSRTQHTAYRLVKQTRSFGDFSQKRVLRITTDKLAAYPRVLAEVFFDIPYRYLQIVTRRVKWKLATVKKVFVSGTSRSFPKNTPKTQNTSYLERFNLTLRQHVCYWQRKTLGYGKKRTNFNRILWINLYNYNYIQFHKGLRQKIGNNADKFKKHYQHLTPAMAMALTTGPRSWRFLLTVPIIVTH